MTRPKKDMCRLKTMETASIWSIINQHDAMLFHTCKKYSHSKQDAEDAHSQIKIKLYMTLFNQNTEIEEIKNMSAWLKTFTRNYCIDLYRQAQRLNEKIIYNVDEPNHFAVDSDTPDSRTVQMQLENKVVEEINSLPDRLRQVAIKRLLHEESFHQISEDLNIRPCNARKRFQEAKQILKVTLGKE